MRIYGFAFLPYYYKNPGSFPLNLYLKRKNICGYLKVKEYEIISRGKGILKLIHILRVHLIKHVERFPDPLRFFTLGIVLGAKELVPEQEKVYFYRLGLGHLFAVSGFHFGIILSFSYLILLLFLKSMGLIVRFPLHLIPSKSAHLLNLCLVPVVLIITGFQISAVRASIMYTLFVLLYLFERDLSLYRIAVVAFIIMFLFNPFDITGPGFEYTFVAVFTIAFIIEKFKNLSYIRSSVLISLTLSIVLMPITAFHFHRVYPLSLISNIIFLPVFSFLIPFMIAVVCLSFFNKSYFIVSVSNTIVKVFYDLIKLLSSSKYSELWVTRTETIITVAVALIVAYFLFRKKEFIFLLIIVSALAIYSYVLNHKNRVVFFDMGKRGNASLIMYKGKKILVDAGGWGRLGGDALIGALLWQDVKKLDKIILTSFSKGSASYLMHIKKVMDVKRIEKPKGNIKCRDVSLANICFFCDKRICHCDLCKIKNGPVIVKGKSFYPWKSGAITVSLED